MLKYLPPNAAHSAKLVAVSESHACPRSRAFRSYFGYFGGPGSANDSNRVRWHKTWDANAAWLMAQRS